MLTILSVVILAVTLPQIVHSFAGSVGGVKFLPMYLPVLLGGCLLGAKYGLVAGLLSPLASYLFTTLALGTAMPSAERLPFMMLELSVMAVVTGLFSCRISRNPLFAFVAVPTALVVGRGMFLLSVVLLQTVTNLTPNMILGQIRTGLVGALIQAVSVPLLVIIIAKLSAKEQ